MKALDRSLYQRYTIIEHGQLKLPSFQRHEAWDSKRIVSFLNAVINNLPLGITLLLQVGEAEQFRSRYITSAPKETRGSVTEQLLDGQQRLTAFWRLMQNNYEGEKYFVYIPELCTNQSRKKAYGDELIVHKVGRWKNKEGQQMPIRADEEKDLINRGLIPTEVLSPVNETGMSEFLEAGLEDVKPSKEDTGEKRSQYHDLLSKWKDKITKMREIIYHFNLPYLALPSTTSKDVALQVFINMNTNSKPLSIYDIIVAEVEQVKEQSLHELYDKINTRYPNIQKYLKLEHLILETSALMQEKMPNNKGMLNMDKGVMIDNREEMLQGMAFMAEFLEQEKIFDAKRLPTNVVPAVIAALYPFIGTKSDEIGYAKTLLKKYLWSSFFTDRYENASANNAYNDYLAMKKILTKKTHEEDGSPYSEVHVPVLNREQYPLVDIDELKKVGRPTKGIRSKGMLLVSLQYGAIDFATNDPISVHNISKREYHHVFPKALLNEARITSDLALNSMLVSKTTNREVGRQDPLKYIQDRYEGASLSEVKRRLHSHVIPFDELENGGYEDVIGEDKMNKLKKDYDMFITKRAEMVLHEIQKLCDGQSLDHGIEKFETEEKSFLQLITQEEDDVLEFKSTLRWDVVNQIKNKEMEESVIKTIIAFMNSRGGSLFIGVTDDHKIHGLETDYLTLRKEGKKDQDLFELHFNQLFKNYIGSDSSGLLKVKFHNIDGKDICQVIVNWSTTGPVFLNKKIKDFEMYIRIGNSSVPISGEEMHSYIKRHWG